MPSNRDRDRGNCPDADLVPAKPAYQSVEYYARLLDDHSEKPSDVKGGVFVLVNHIIACRLPGTEVEIIDAIANLMTAANAKLEQLGTGVRP